MLKPKARMRRLLIGIVGVVLTMAPAAAETVEEFYTKKNTLILLAGTRPGGSYGLYGGILAKYMSQFIPGKPADRVAALREAFVKTMTDPGFLAECKSRNLTIRPRTAAEVHAFVNTIVNATPELVARVKKETAGPSSKRVKKK